MRRPNSRARNERELLLACTRVELGTDPRSVVDRSAVGPLDWQRLVQLAASHRVAALVAKHLSHCETVENVPQDPLSSLRGIYEANVYLYLRSKADLSRLLRLLHEADIPVVVLKGMVLAELLYSDVALRPMGDIDILVKEEHLDQAYSMICQNLGYSSGLSPEIERAEKASHRHYPRLVDASGTLRIEVHRHILRQDVPFYFDCASLWERAQPISIGDVDVLSLGFEDLLTHLCLGLFLDSRSRYPSRKALARVLDIAKAIQVLGEGLDWDLWLEQVRTRKLRGPVAWSLRVTEELLDVAPPPEPMREVCDGLLSPDQIDFFIEQRIFRETPWILHELLDPGDHTKWKGIKAAGKRILPSRGQLEATYRTPRGSVPVSRLYRWYLSEMRASTAAYLVHPGALYQDLKLYRWLYHSYAGN